MKNIGTGKVSGWFVAIIMIITMALRYEAIIETAGLWLFMIMLVITMVLVAVLLGSGEEEDC